MVRPIFVLAALLSLAALSACATMSDDECRTADWRVVGEADGARGYDPTERFAAHVKSCRSADIVPDQALWHDGYRVGLVRYCTPLNGLAEGEAGRAYHKVCPAPAEPGFLSGYLLGKKAHDLRSQISSNESSIDWKEREIDKLTDQLKSADASQRGKFRADIEDLERDIRSLRYDIGRAESDLGRVERDIEWFRQHPDAPGPMRLD